MSYGFQSSADIRTFGSNKKNMNRITEWFLKQTASKIFLLGLLGIPIYIWLFSIIYQLDKRQNENENENENSFKKIILGVVTIVPIVYFFILIGFFFNVFGENTFLISDFIMPSYLIAISSALILMIVGANSYGKYEEEKGYKTYESLGVFFLLWVSIVGIWVLQPNLNKYVKE